MIAPAFKYDPTDRTHAQISPLAFDLVTRNGGIIEPGQREDKSPNFRGLKEQWWKDLARDNSEDWKLLVNVCMADFPTACALLLYVVSRMTGEVHTYIFNNGQRIVWNRMVQRMMRGEPCFFVILKARQLGITTIVAAWHFWNLWKASDIHSLNVAHDKPLAERIVQFFRVFYDHLPNVGGMKPKLRAESRNATIPKHELYFADNRSHGETHVSKNLDPRGNTSRFIGESEAAYYHDLLSFNDALMPQLPSIGSPARAKCSFIIESTPNGQNEFYEYWEDCKEADSEFWGIFLPWFVADDEYVLDPPAEWRMDQETRDLQKALTLARRSIDGKDVSRAQMYWRELTVRNKPFSGDVEAFDEAYPSDDESCFMLRSESVFKNMIQWLHQCVRDGNVRAQLAWSKRMDTKGKQIQTNGPVRGKLSFPALNSPFEPVFHRKHNKPKFVMEELGPLWVWEPPVADHIYFVGADSAAGELNRDESVAFVIDVSTGIQVAEFASTDYTPEAFADNLVHLCLWYHKAMILPEVNGLGSVVMKRMSNDWGYTNIAHEEKWDEVGVKKDKPGFYTNERNRPLIFSALRWMVEERYLIISSSRLLKQMSTFKKDGMDYRTAKKSQHDDKVVAAGLACIGLRQAPRHMMTLMSARSQRAPTAVDLGLNHNPAPEHTIRNADQALVESIFGNDNAWTIPMNPLRGDFDF